MSTIVTDENYDDEYESICRHYGIPYWTDSKFVDELDEEFSYCDDYYVRESVKPNRSIDCKQPIIISDIAFRFANGYMVFYIDRCGGEFRWGEWEDLVIETRR